MYELSRTDESREQTDSWLSRAIANGKWGVEGSECDWLFEVMKML